MRMFMATWPIGLLIALLSACATTREARLYDALGGEAGVAKLVDAITAEYREDTKIGFLFQDTDQDYFRARLREHICQISDGGCEYTGLSRIVCSLASRRCAARSSTSSRGLRPQIQRHRLRHRRLGNA